MLSLPSFQRSPLRVAFLVPKLGLGGADTWLLSLLAGFSAARPAGLVVRNVAFRGTQEMVQRYMPVTAAASREAAQHALRELAARSDVLVSWGCEDLAELAGDLPIPIVHLSKVAAEFASQARVTSASARGANYVAAISETARSALPEALQAQATVVYNGVDPTRVAPRQGRDALRSQWRLADADRLILFTGRLAPEKNPLAIVAALVHLPASYKALFVGPDAGMLVRIQEQGRLVAPGRVLWTPTAYHLGDLLAAADCFCSPSDSEGFGNAVVEAHLAGLPVVTCGHRMSLEFEELHGPLAWLVAVRPAPHQLAAAIEQAASAGRTAPRVVHARDVAWSHYTSASMAARWELYLHDIIEDYRSHALHPVLNVVV